MDEKGKHKRLKKVVFGQLRTSDKKLTRDPFKVQNKLEESKKPTQNPSSRVDWAKNSPNFLYATKMVQPQKV